MEYTLASESSVFIVQYSSLVFEFEFDHSVFLTISSVISSTPPYRLPFVSLSVTDDAISASTQPLLRA